MRFKIGLGNIFVKVLNFVIDYVVDFDIYEKGKDFIKKWYYNFMREWFELYVVKCVVLLGFLFLDVF